MASSAASSRARNNVCSSQFCVGLSTRSARGAGISHAHILAGLSAVQEHSRASLLNIKLGLTALASALIAARQKGSRSAAFSIRRPALSKPRSNSRTLSACAKPPRRRPSHASNSARHTRSGSESARLSDFVIVSSLAKRRPCRASHCSVHRSGNCVARWCQPRGEGVGVQMGVTMRCGGLRVA